ncbi:MCE family protein [Alistipes sp. OttesenSCG-928-B03]|nr:MCE family protein [Alistipes sp. OttesenSCG-928-B03]
MKIKREAKIGLFALITLFALYWGISWLQGKDIFNRTNVYYATYDQVNGIQKSSAIVIKGFKVGVIGDISYDPRKSDKIVLQFNVDSDYKIPANSQARIYSDGLLGGKAIEIVMGNAEQYLQSGDTLHSSADKDILELAGSELEFLKQKVTQVADNLNKTLTSINGVFEDNSANLNKTLANIAEMTGSLNGVVTGQRESLESIVANINTLSAVLKDKADNIENIVDNLDGFSGSLAEADIKGVAENLSAAVAQLQGLLASVNKGEGSLGKLLNDDALYDSLLEASGNLGGLLEDLKENPGRYVNISVFGRKNK